jgi:N-acetylmuramoyl-L-alanine amidase
MPQPSNVKFIVGHCSAGFGNITSLQRWWRTPRSSGGPGWKSKGYHAIVEEDGTIWYLFSNTAENGYTTDSTKWRPDLITNGVQGFNSNSIHICYIGGVDRNNVRKAQDTRTHQQRRGFNELIKMIFIWLKDNGNDLSDLMILGHRDFSKDKNANNIIEPWERIKECPSFDMIPEYSWVLKTANNPANILPNK